MKQKIADTYRVFYCSKPNTRKEFCNRMADYYNDPVPYERFRLKLIITPAMNAFYSVAVDRADTIMNEILDLYNIYNPMLPEDDEWPDIDIIDYWWVK